MTRYLRTLLVFWRAAVSAELEYRLNFVLALVTSVGSLAGGLFGLSLFYQRSFTFPGWSWNEALCVLGTFTALTGFSATLLTPNLGRIVTHIEKGTLDFVLLKPLDSQFQVSMREVSLWGLPDVGLGIGLVVYGGLASGVEVTALWRGLLPLGVAMVLLYALWFLLASSAIWFVKVYNATEVLRGLLDAGRFPIAAYPVTFRVFFTFVVPVAFLTTVPAEALLGRSDVTWVGGALLLSAVMFALARAFWRYALRSYTSASS